MRKAAFRCAATPPPQTPAPIGALERQYVTVAIGRIVAVKVLGALAAMQISY
jgi:hypothetical protein